MLQLNFTSAVRPPHPPVAPSLQSLFEKSKLMNSPSPSGGGVSVKSSLSAKSKSKSSSSLKESTGASNIHPLIDMNKLLMSQVRKSLGFIL